ncbi:hypothetical protein KUTeg_008421 [Tegillarca granosa]|uniref:Coiled-coil domain-containing protein n=1 Tax=Tegillarca granosa TaxID=220873 RepID=A0ABQ9FDZ4_TEGGR|nr:hypothetical protein KUTeg_008421 [Tegillarca granosa]
MNRRPRPVTATVTKPDWMKPHVSPRSRSLESNGSTASLTSVLDHDSYISPEEKATEDEAKLSAWEKWLITKTREEREKRREKTRQKKELKQEKKQKEQEKQKQLQKAEEKRKEWLERKNYEEKLRKRLEKQRISIEKDIKESQKREIDIKAEKKFSEWKEAKNREEKEQKKVQKMQQREKEIERIQKKELAEEKFKEWCKKAQKRPKSVPNSFGYIFCQYKLFCNIGKGSKISTGPKKKTNYIGFGDKASESYVEKTWKKSVKSAGYHDTNAYPVPTFYNPIPWHPIQMGMLQRNFLKT